MVHPEAHFVAPSDGVRHLVRERLKDRQYVLSSFAQALALPLVQMAFRDATLGHNLMPERVGITALRGDDQSLRYRVVPELRVADELMAVTEGYVQEHADPGDGNLIMRAVDSGERDCLGILKPREACLHRLIDLLSPTTDEGIIVADTERSAHDDHRRS